jgi:hypothetical protein
MSAIDGVRTPRRGQASLNRLSGGFPGIAAPDSRVGSGGGWSRRISLCVVGRHFGCESVQVKVRQGTEEIVGTAVLKSWPYDRISHPKVLCRSVEVGGGVG